MRVRKSILIVALLGFCGAWSGCSSHKEPAPASASSAPPQVFANGTPAPPPIVVPAQGGFGGIACGAPPLPAMKLLRATGDVTFYARPSDPMQIANGQLSGETYRFYRNQFEGVQLQTNNAASSTALLVHMRRLIGPGKLENPNGPVFSSTGGAKRLSRRRMRSGFGASSGRHGRGTRRQSASLRAD
jgi:hypothetical protein